MTACHRGYTLLELVVVLGIVALATALVAPPGYRLIRTWQEATALQDVFEQLERLPASVRNSGNPLTVETFDESGLIKLPEGWLIQMSPPLRIQANGVCFQTQGSIITPQRAIALSIEAPFCRVIRTEP